MRWAADLNALTLAWTVELPQPHSQWTTVEWSSDVFVHASEQEALSLCLVFETDEGHTRLKADSQPEFAGWFASLQAWDAFNRISRERLELSV